VEVQSSTGEVTATQVRDNNDGSHTASFVAQQIGKVKMSVGINGEKIKEFPATCVHTTDYIAINEPRKIVQVDGMPSSIAFAPNGFWALTDRSNHCVYIFDGKDQLIKKFGTKGSDNVQFDCPYGSAFDRNGYLYISDSTNKRIQKFDSNYNCVLQFGYYGKSDAQLHIPRGIAIHNGVADSGNKCISVFFTDGKYFHHFGKGMTEPYGVAVSSSGHLLVTDYSYPCHIHVFTLDGNKIRKISHCGSAKGQLNCPHGVVSDRNGFILVADSFNCRVSIFKEDGSFVHSFGSRGNGIGQFSSISGITLSSNNNLYVCDIGNQIFFMPQL